MAAHDDTAAAVRAISWIDAYRIRVLNVAGPRARGQADARARAVLEGVLVERLTR